VVSLLLNVFNVFTFKRVLKLKQCTNLILHDKNYISFVGSVLVHKMGRGEGGPYSRGDAYFKVWLIGGAFIRRGAYSRGALIQGFTVYTCYKYLPLEMGRNVDTYIQLSPSQGTS